MKAGKSEASAVLPRYPLVYRIDAPAHIPPSIRLAFQFRGAMAPSRFGPAHSPTRIHASPSMPIARLRSSVGLKASHKSRYTRYGQRVHSSSLPTEHFLLSVSPAPVRAPDSPA